MPATIKCTLVCAVCAARDEDGILIFLPNSHMIRGPANWRAVSKGHTQEIVCSDECEQKYDEVLQELQERNAERVLVMKKLKSEPVGAEGLPAWWWDAIVKSFKLLDQRICGCYDILNPALFVIERHRIIPKGVVTTADEIHVRFGGGDNFSLRCTQCSIAWNGMWVSPNREVRMGKFETQDTEEGQIPRSDAPSASREADGPGEADGN